MMSLADLFHAQVARTPSAVALSCGGRDLTYEALNARANQLAWHLSRKRIGPEAVVGVCLPLGIELVVALLAVAKAGAAFVAPDLRWPSAWVTEVLDDAASLVLVGEDESGTPGRFRGEVLSIHGQAAAIAAEPITNVRMATTPDHLFSITYTSGTTGAPKGLMITQRSAINRIQWMWETYPFQSGDRAALYRSAATVGFSWDCFGALLTGIPTAILADVDPRNPGDVLCACLANGVTHLSASAGFWDALLDALERIPAGWPHLRLARTTGEPLRPRTLERWRRLCPQVPLLNIYGATECSGSMAYDTSTFQTASALRVPVGTPISGVSAVVVNRDLRPLDEGEEGEVCIGGASLARGYLRQPAATAERFIPDPTPTSPGARVFRTGDIGCWRTNGQLELIGRRDLQVKIRGVRVELEDVEAALRACPGVTAAAVRADRDEQGVRLVAFVSSRLATPPSSREIRAAMQQAVPVHMTPSDFVLVDALPRTASGKINRAALTDLRGRALEQPADAVAPTTPAEAALASIWQSVLGIETVGIDDDFFELGGHSLTGLQILSRVYETFGIELPLGVLFRAQTVKALASEIEMDARAR